MKLSVKIRNKSVLIRVQKEGKMIKEKFKSEIREWAESIIIALILALLIRTFVIQAFKIPSGSMIPTFKIGDRIFVSKFIYGARIPFTDIRLPALRQPRRGDIIVFVSPEAPKKDFVDLQGQQNRCQVRQAEKER